MSAPLPPFRLDWIVPNRVAALTHTTPIVTSNDYLHILQRLHVLLSASSGPVHIVIDNRMLAMPRPVSLADMQRATPLLNHPNLRWLVAIAPTSLGLDEAAWPVESNGNVHLRNVASLASAIEQLQLIDATLANTTFDLALFDPATLPA